MEGSERNHSKSPLGSTSRAKNFSQEQLIKAIEKKKKCDERALAIVEEMLEPVEDVSNFLLKLKEINQSHYQDIVEERVITKLCGYPLCKERILEVAKKQYHISTKTNRVYDITERKSFCSNSCFKASNYLKDQLLISPLWLRDIEVIPEFELLSISKED